VHQRDLAALVEMGVGVDFRWRAVGCQRVWAMPVPARWKSSGDQFVLARSLRFATLPAAFATSIFPPSKRAIPAES